MNEYKGTAIFELGDQRVPYQVALRSFRPTYHELGRWQGWIINPDDRIFDYIGQNVDIELNGNVGNVFMASFDGKLIGSGIPPF